ncbi:TOBE domain-containing protein [Cohaesibacter sp. ES.047]|uniref:ABC transporter ATP-binding protein n=1 Tax=Cohaesibacter sp. ES.047 TaxID=1798205 RepID=UPI000BB6F419|nr:sn-glycerol-3-phosphate ABC transporter ATP-binding protein UgpC [Cohaesibacter sp. ES.047]SNY90201.1 TOBE domain-containing protein [Cohaesibacter sp. ES.047]
MANLELKKVVKKFEKTEVIRSVDLEVKSGEFVVFVGPSGCGKSTLLRLIAGLETVTSGAVVIDGEDVTKKEPSDRGIAMVFQTYALYPHMTVEQNMAFGLEMAGIDKTKRTALVKKAAETLQLELYLKRKPKALSGGQRQRVAIGRAIVREPKIFLFDEPLSNLDAELRVQMRLEIARLHAELGATMVYVTHDQVEAMTLASRIVVLRDGCVEQIGTPDELYSNPDNVFVASFIGSPKMNIIGAKVTGRADNGAALVSVPELGVENLAVMPRDRSAQLPPDVRIGIRPEHFDTEPGEANFTVKCAVIEKLGGVSYVYTDTGRENALTIEMRGMTTPIRPDDNLDLSISGSDCLLFSTGGARL